MQDSRPSTVGALKRAGYLARSVRDELRANLMARLASGEPLFPGIVGYEDTVLPQVVNAILAKQHFILLGLRGQAKTGLIRQLVGLLDEAVPVLEGSEINDDPVRPVSRHGRALLDELGDEAPVRWVPRETRYVEKLATPDVTVADLIGDLDPVRAARGGHVLADELTIHFGLVPRANRGIFALNELPDLAAKVQVALFNIMQEGDVQIKGFPVRLPLDVMLVFTANPEDYTARGKIITPLKDRIGAEILTHYPETVDAGVAITRQEAWVERNGQPVEIPPFVAELVERVAFLAREDKRVDQRSGVSQRMPITLLENVVSNAERRALLGGETMAVARPGDLYAALPAITGKLELEYEGELVGAGAIARDLIARAAAATLDALRDGGEVGSLEAQLDRIAGYFQDGGALRFAETSNVQASLDGFAMVDGLLNAAEALGYRREDSAGATAAACELVLEALVAERQISRSESGDYLAPPRRRPAGPGGPGGSGGSGGYGPAGGPGRQRPSG